MIGWVIDGAYSDSWTEAIFGHSPDKRPIALMITCPSEAADDPAFMHALAERGVESIRINCAPFR